MFNYDKWKTTNDSAEALERERFILENMSREDLEATLINDYREDADFVASCSPAELVDILFDRKCR